MLLALDQPALFAAPCELPHGLIYHPDFVSPAEEAGLLRIFATLPFHEARFQQYTARRRVVRYGEGDNIAYRSTGLAGSTGEAAVDASRPLPAFLLPLRRRVAAWRGLPETDYVHALVTEYPPGAPIGWHSDAPHFEEVVGISLAGSARMRFRPAATNPGQADQARRKAAIALELAPRSAYLMQGDIRWHWQHHIPPLGHRRYSVTFRTLRQAGNAGNAGIAGFGRA